MYVRVYPMRDQHRYATSSGMAEAAVPRARRSRKRSPRERYSTTQVRTAGSVIIVWYAV